MRIFLAAVTLLLSTTPAWAQWLDRKTPGLARTSDGKPNLAAPAPRADGKPDLSGVWNGPVPALLLDRANAQPWANAAIRKTIGSRERVLFCIVLNGMSHIDTMSDIRLRRVLF